MSRARQGVYRPRAKRHPRLCGPGAIGDDSIGAVSATSTRRLAWTSYGTAVGLALGTVAALATEIDTLAAVGAAIGAIGGLIIGRRRERRT